MVVRDDPASPWKRLGEELCAADESVDVDNSPGLSTIGIKRALSPSNSNAPDAKRARGASQALTRQSRSCLAPKPNYVAQTIIENWDTPAEASLGTGDIFLTENFRERWCRCASVGIHMSMACLISRSTAC
jgi:E3 ubiquitin-protein ligase UBR7